MHSQFTIPLFTNCKHNNYSLEMSKMPKMPKRYATSDDWEPQRLVIAQLYREEGKTLQETIDYMAREHKFFAT